MNSQPQCSLLKRLLLPFCLFVCAIIFYFPANAQENPPKPITVTVSTLQNLNFGTFVLGNGSGTSVIISSEGLRSWTGDIVLISSSFSAALYAVKSIPGTLITISNGTDALLYGSNGGSMTMHIGDSYPLSPFITTSDEATVTIGGTLTVGASGANPPGIYGGSFSVTFIQQ